MQKRLVDVSRHDFEGAAELKTYSLGCALSGLWWMAIRPQPMFHVLHMYLPVQLIKGLLGYQADPNALMRLGEDPGAVPYQSWHQYLGALCNFALCPIEDSAVVFDLLADFIAAGADIHTPLVLSRNYPWESMPSWKPWFKITLWSMEFRMSPLGVLWYYANRLPWYKQLERTMITAGARCSQEIGSRDLLVELQIRMIARYIYASWSKIL